MIDVFKLATAADDLWVRCCYGKGNAPVQLTVEDKARVERVVKQLTDILAGQEDYEEMIRRTLPFLRSNAA